MTAQPNDRAVELVAQSFMGGAEPCEGAWSDATAALAAICDALGRGGDDADAIAQAIGLRDTRLPSVLFNDVTHGLPTDARVRFSYRRALADYLWQQGWRRPFRDSDVTEPTNRIEAGHA